jgi:uncharacterized protein YndB with AHSA1/START domain
MKKLQFSTEIMAPKQKVWETLWADDNYRAWTSVFTEGSHAVTDWNEGSKVHFLDGKGAGMYGIIEKKVDATFMSFRHIGEIKDGVEQPVDDRMKNWSEGRENYTLTQSGGITTLTVDLGAPEEFVDYFSGTFPKALAKVKEMAEA